MKIFRKLLISSLPLVLLTSCNASNIIPTEKAEVTKDIPLTGKVSPVEKSVVDVPVAKKVVAGVRADKVFAHLNKTGFSVKALRGFTKCEDLGSYDYLPGADWFGQYNCDNDGTKLYYCTNLPLGDLGKLFFLGTCR